MARWDKKTGNYIQDGNNTMINVTKKTKEELKLLLLDESVKRGDRVHMKGFIEELLKFYKDNNVDKLSDFDVN